MRAAEGGIERRAPVVVADSSTLAPLRSALQAQSAPEELAVAASMSLTCRVVDEYGRGVKGAEVWADDGEYRLRGTTRAEGLFTLELDARTVLSLWRGGCSVQVGARHSKLSPSMLSAWSAPREHELVLELRGLGAELQVQVVDTAGIPISGVELHVGLDLNASDSPLRHDGTPGRVTPNPPTTSDPWGRALMLGLEPGLTRVQLHAEGYCPRSLSIQLFEGERTIRRLQLLSASSLRGRLTLADGRVLDCARVTAVGEDPEYAVEAFVDERGEFILRNVPAGHVALHAECRERGAITHAASTELTLRPGELRTWDAILFPVGVLSGRLVDADGSPLIGWRIELQFEGAVQEPLHVTQTDEDGRYNLPDSHTGRVAQLFLYHPDAAGGLPTRVLQDPRNRDREGELQLNPGEDRSVRLKGRLRDAQGRPAFGIPFRVRRLSTGQEFSMTTSIEDASFETPALPPDSYILIFYNHGRGWIPNVSYQLGDTDTLDIGSLSLPLFGRLALSPAERARTVDCPDIKLVLHRPEIAPDFTYVVHDGRVDLPIEVDLAPGEYVLQLNSMPEADRVPFEVLSTFTTHLVVACE